MNKNKNKGKAYERNVANYLTNLYGLSFKRVPNSGAFIGGKNFSRKKGMSSSQILLSKGDIIPPDEMKNLVIECKSYKNFPFHRLISNQKIPLLESWIKQVKNDINDNDIWLIFFKIANKGEYVINGNTNLKARVLYRNVGITEKKEFFHNNAELLKKLVSGNE